MGCGGLSHGDGGEGKEVLFEEVRVMVGKEGGREEGERESGKEGRRERKRIK